MKEIVAGLQVNATNCAFSFFETVKGMGHRIVEHGIVEAPIGTCWDIFNVNAADAVNKKFIEFENRHKVKIKKIIYVVPLEKLKRIDGRAQMVLHPRSSRQVSVLSVEKLMEQARLLSVDWHYRSVHSFPYEYKLDGKVFTTPPLGIYGRKFEVKSYFYALDNDYMINLDSFFQYMGRKYSDVAASSLCEISFFDQDTLKRGNLALLNLGLSGSEVSLYKGFALVDIKVFDCKDIIVDEVLSSSLNVPVEMAKELMMSYGAFTEEDGLRGNTIYLEVGGRKIEIAHAKLCSVLSDYYGRRLSLISDYLKEKEEEIAIDDVYIMGGWTSVAGAQSLAQRYFRYPVSLPSFCSLYEQNQPAANVASSGAVFFAKSRFNFSNAYSLSNRLWTSIRNIWEEYF